MTDVLLDRLNQIIDEVGDDPFWLGVNVGPFQAVPINNIGSPGTQGFGVGICPLLPTGYTKMHGTNDAASNNYGNYKYADGSIMVWVPAFYYKIGTDSNGLSINRVDIKAVSVFPDLASANADGYALHRAFYNAGKIQPGVFVDKYQCSYNIGVASSIKNGNPLSTSVDHNPLSDLIGAPTNTYGGAVLAAKTRGSKFFCSSIFIQKMLALLSLAHAQASTNTVFCAWYDASGVTNYPKGCNNDALGDTSDSTLLYVPDGYLNCAKTGSVNALAKTTHNGQSCGVADLNGNMWEVSLGLTSNGTNYYLLKTTADITKATNGNTQTTDLWGVAGLAAQYDNLGATYASLTASGANKIFGAATQVLATDTNGLGWAMTGAGIPLTTGVGGSNTFGNDLFIDARPNELCVRSGASWGDANNAGVWTLLMVSTRSSTNHAVGFRSASYL